MDMFGFIIKAPTRTPSNYWVVIKLLEDKPFFKNG